MFKGSEDLTATQHEKSTWVARLEKAGGSEAKLAPELPFGHRPIFYVIGCAAAVVGVFLLIGGLVSSAHIIW